MTNRENNQLTEKTPNIGDLLIKLNKIKPDDVNNILKKQQETGMKFGDAARALGLIQQTDIDYVLSSQFDYSLLHLSSNVQLDKSLKSAYEPFSDYAESIRELRGELISRWISDQNKLLSAVTAGDDQNACSVVANLAISFAQIGIRVLLVDSNLRNPQQSKLFGISNNYGLSDILIGRADLTCSHKIDGFKNLYLLTSGTFIPNPHEILYQNKLSDICKAFAENFDIVIFDTTPLSMFIDSLPIISECKGALLISTCNETSIPNIQSILKKIQSVNAKVIGSLIVK